AKRRNRAGLASACIVWRLCPSDQPLRHGVGNGGGIATALRALAPDLFKSNGDALDALADEARVSIAEIFGADVDDPAGVDDVIRCVEDSPSRQSLAIPGSSELIVRAARDDRRLQRSNRLLGQDRTQRVRADDIGFEPEDLIG